MWCIETYTISFLRVGIDIGTILITLNYIYNSIINQAELGS
jgi:hypothetical protein